MTLTRVNIALLGVFCWVALAACGDIKVAGLDGGVPPQDTGGPDAVADGGGPIDLVEPDEIEPPECQTDKQCRDEGAGFFCRAGRCENGDVEGRFLLVVQVADGAPVTNPRSPVYATADEDGGPFVLDASGSIYLGSGTPSWQWELVDDAGFRVHIDDPAAASTIFDVADVSHTDVIELRLTASDGTADVQGTATATVQMTLRDTLNDMPQIVVVAQPEDATAGTTVILDASGTSDPNGDALVSPFVWEQTDGAEVTLDYALSPDDRQIARFTAPSVDVDQYLWFRVRVTDQGTPAMSATMDVPVLIWSGGCESHGDCDDGNSCTADRCLPSGACDNSAVGDGIPCDDDDECTTQDSCIEGICEGGSARVCDDGNPCTTDSCDAAEGCQFLRVADLPCDDGDPCTTGDRCEAGQCVGSPGACGCESDADCPSDGNLCNGVEFCDTSLEQPACSVRADTVVTCVQPLWMFCAVLECQPTSGECVEVPAFEGEPCEDGLICTVDDVCESGECKPGAPASCDDGDPCTMDYCDDAPMGGELPGCRHDLDPTCCSTDDDCNDFDPCTVDACVEGACTSQGVPGMACCAADEDCDDGDPCTSDWCDADHTCQNDWDPTACCQVDQDCDDDDWCTHDSCFDGLCLNEPFDSCCSGDTECDDGDPCTFDECFEGQCSNLAVPGMCCVGDTECEDGNPCTADYCDPNGQCQHDFIPGGCCQDDSDCDDGNPCTDDSCAATTGTCSFTTRPLGSPCQLSSGSSEPRDFHGGLCDALGACQEFARKLLPDVYDEQGTRQFLGVWAEEGTGDLPEAWAVGRRQFELGSPIGTGIGMIYRLSGTDIGEEKLASTSGAFTAVHRGLAVGPDKPARFDVDRQGWAEQEFAGDVGPTMRTVYGFDGASYVDEPAWYVGTLRNEVYRCSGGSTWFGNPWTCTLERTGLPTTNASGPLWGYSSLGGGQYGLGGHLWFLGADGSGGRLITYGTTSLIPPESTWSMAAPLGCAGCSLGAWRDVHGTMGDRGGDVWAVGDQGTLYRRRGETESWYNVSLPSELLEGLANEKVHWQAVFVHGDSAYVAGYTDECLMGGCQTDNEYRTLVAMRLSASGNDHTGLIVLDRATCSRRTDGTDLLCEEYPVTSASISDMWAQERDGQLTLWIVGAWPEYFRGDRYDIRASVYSLQFTADGTYFPM